MENLEIMKELIQANDDLANLMRNAMNWKITLLDDLDAFTHELTKVQQKLGYAKDAAVREVTFT